MKIAIEEHLKCTEFPKVGAVVANKGLLLSTGFRGEKKGVHAERVSIEKLDFEQLKDSTLFTTLEPCVKLDQSQPIESCSELLMNYPAASVRGI